MPAGPSVSLFIPCFVDQLYPQVGLDAVRVLRRAGCSVEFRREQTCCGQPACNSGYWPEARPLARRFLEVFADADVIVCPSGSCTAMVRNLYPQLFPAGSPEHHAARTLGERTFEFAEFLVRRLGVTDLGATFPHRVAFHDACHALRELGLKQEPRALLRQVRGLELVELEDAEECCGFGGTFATKFGALSAGIGERKCGRIAAAQVEYVTSCDASCLMQLEGLLRRRGATARTLHLASLLAGGDQANGAGRDAA